MNWRILFEPIQFSSLRYGTIIKRVAFELSFLVSLLLVAEFTLWVAGQLLLIPRKVLDALREPEEGAYRILAIGESTTFGLGVNREDAYPEVLERLLNESGNVNCVVFNTGVPGQTSTSILRSIQYQLEKYRPDLVISLIGANDLNEALNDMNSRRFLGLNVPKWIANLRTYRLACVIRDFVVYRPTVAEDGSWVTFDEEQMGPSGEYVQNAAFLKQLELNYADIIDVIKAADSKVVILSYMRCYYAVPPCLQRIAETESVPFLDFHSEETDGSEWYTEDYFHPNEKGHKVMADKLKDFLERRRLLEKE